MNRLALRPTVEGGCSCITPGTWLAMWFLTTCSFTFLSFVAVMVWWSPFPKHCYPFLMLSHIILTATALLVTSKLLFFLSLFIELYSDFRYDLPSFYLYCHVHTYFSFLFFFLPVSLHYIILLSFFFLLSMTSFQDFHFS